VLASWDHHLPPHLKDVREDLRANTVAVPSRVSLPPLLPSPQPGKEPVSHFHDTKHILSNDLINNHIASNISLSIIMAKKCLPQNLSL
jgi:hypothetical protein